MGLPTMLLIGHNRQAEVEQNRTWFADGEETNRMRRAPPQGRGSLPLAVSPEGMWERNITHNVERLTMPSRNVDGMSTKPFETPLSGPSYLVGTRNMDMLVLWLVLSNLEQEGLNANNSTVVQTRNGTCTTPNGVPQSKTHKERLAWVQQHQVQSRRREKKEKRPNNGDVDRFARLRAVQQVLFYLPEHIPADRTLVYWSAIRSRLLSMTCGRTRLAS